MDRDYRFSALGTLAQAYPEEVQETFRRWVAQEIAAESPRTLLRSPHAR